MSMNFDDDIEGMFDTDDFGKEATYQRRDGSPSFTINVIFNRPQSQIQNMQITRMIALTPASGLSDPKPRDQVTVAGGTYTVTNAEFIDADQLVWQLELK